MIRSCMKCGKRGELEGLVEGVRVTVCCEACCRKFKVSFEKLYAGEHRLPEKLCMTNYGCSKNDLAELKHIVLYYPSRDRKIRFYLGAEVKCLGEVRNFRRWSLAQKRRRRELQELGVKLKRMDPVLAMSMVGDYLQLSGSVKTTLDNIKQRFAVFDRVKRIRKANKLAHPDAAFEFCLRYPEGTVEDFAELKEKASKVFRLEGDRIMRHLTKAERDGLLDSPLKDVVEAFRNRDKKLIIRGQLEKWVPAGLAEEIVNYPACQLRIEREDDEALLAQKLWKFWKEKACGDTRRQELRDMLIEKDVAEASYCFPQKMYVFGLIDCDADEIVGLKEISSKAPFPILTDGRIERVSIAVTRFEDCLHAKNMTYEASIAEAIQYAKRVPLPVADCLSETWDCQQLANGFWSGRWHML